MGGDSINAGQRRTAVRGADLYGFTASFYYDGAGRLSSMHNDPPGTANDMSLAFAYSPASQIVSRTRTNDAYAWTEAYDIERSYARNGLNQYASAGPAAFEYDGRGNLTKSTTSGVASTFHYDAENRLVGAGGNRSVNFRYDPLGRLYQVSGSGVPTTRFLYDGDALVAEYGSTGTLLRRYVHGPGVDEPVALYEGAAVAIANRAYFQPDERGSIIALVNADGRNRTIKTCDEYGIPAGAADGPVAQGRFAYTGQAWLPEIGMYYYKARIYSPTLGRFLQVDPIGYEDQINLYAYVRGDPINASDPSGMCSSISEQSVQSDCFEKREAAVADAAEYLSGQSVKNGKDEAAYIATYDEESREVTVRTGDAAGIRTQNEVVFTDANGGQLRALPDGRIVKMGEDGTKSRTSEIVLATGHGHIKENPGGGGVSRSLDRANEYIRNNPTDQALSKIAPAVIKTPSGKIKVYVQGKQRK